MKKIEKQELEKIQKQQEELNVLINNIGFLETQKHNFLHKISELNRMIDSTKVELENKYGSININVETGEYTEIEAEKTPELKVVEDVK